MVNDVHILSAPSKYRGKYVAYSDFFGKTIVASGNTPTDVLKRARKKGFKKAVISYIKKTNIAYIY